jgi:hypothetical protein
VLGLAERARADQHALGFKVLNITNAPACSSPTRFARGTFTSVEVARPL